LPDRKTITIDEIVTTKKNDSAKKKGNANWSQATSQNPNSGFSPTPENIFADLQKSLPWKARLTLCLTRWFMSLWGKSYGKLVIIPITVIGALMAIPLGLLFLCFLITRSFFRSLR
jgi:hypothetical protein